MSYDASDLFIMLRFEISETPLQSDFVSQTIGICSSSSKAPDNFYFGTTKTSS